MGASGARGGREALLASDGLYRSLAEALHIEPRLVPMG
jgi:hypothetical protein